jgi:hypothetical protein
MLNATAGALVIMGWLSNIHQHISTAPADRSTHQHIYW